MIGEHHAVANHDGRIEDSSAVIFRITRDQRDTAYLAYQPVDRIRDLSAHSRVKQQVLRGYPDTASSGSSTTSACERSRASFAAATMRDVLPSTSADDQVELRHDTSQPPWLGQFLSSLLRAARRCPAGFLG